MSQKLALFLALMLSGLTIGSFPRPADAKTPLTRAVIQALRNRVQLMQKSRPVRSARVSDAMAPGDALATARASLAELRFNDGSLARVGEQAVFRFVPNARTFQLSNGTMLLLIPPGRGPTGVRTPNAAAGIKGSALFVRYIPDTDTTLVGALTNNPQGPMVIYNRDASQSQGLRAGQLAVIVKNRIEQVYDFDLNTFYETSDLVKGLNLTQKDAASPSDEAIAAVRAETVEALQGQSSFKNANVIENPTFVRLPSELAGFPDNNLDRIFNSVDVRRAIDPEKTQSDQTAASPQQPGAGSGSVPPVAGTTPPATQPPEPVTSTQNPPPSDNPAISSPPEPTPVTSTPRPLDSLGQRPRTVAPTDTRLLTPRRIEPATPISQPSTPTPPVVTTPTPPTEAPTPDQGSNTPPIVVEGGVSGGITPPSPTDELPVVPKQPDTLPNPNSPVTPGSSLPSQTQGDDPGIGQPNVNPPIDALPDLSTDTPPGGSPDVVIPSPPILVEPGSGVPVVPIDPTLPGNFPGQGNTGGNFPGGGNTGGDFPGQAPATPANPISNPINPTGGGQPTDPTNPTSNTPPNGGTPGSDFPGKANDGKFPGKANDGVFPGGGATEGKFPGRVPIDK
ncbi:FecR domain-containing protein [Trichocoleus sp. FACHB-591]|uniref:FecR family protein n=1 Tax=Trichocoleus sp. FACHB-591 TaxID=2692872 RepID=UPI001688BF2B|nr:FecR family protein [Trichocoleus sp. FACHB-591]MBD2097171.1 FecR domain-containing protein [Trichocoleus sp. FACHB-591]